MNHNSRENQPNKKSPVIFDTDPGIDDAMALLYLNACQNLSLKGICTVFGNASIEQCTNNALYLCERFNIQVPVHAGAGATISGVPGSDYPTFVHGDDGLGNLHAKPLSRQQQQQRATDYLIESARKYAGELVIIAVGRMTNIANAIQLSASFSNNVKEIVIMGGAVNVPGNVNEWSEANIIGDPEAAQIMFDSGIPTTQLGLDVTDKTIMDEAYLTDLCESCGDAGDLFSKITPYYLNFYRSRTGINGIACHDSSAVAFAEDPCLYTSETGILSVVLEGEQRGRTLFKPAATGDHKLCTEVDVPGMLVSYKNHLLNTYGIAE